MDMDLDYCLSELKALLSIDSPSGFTDRAAEHLMQALETLGYQPKKTRKGGVLCCLGGLRAENCEAENCRVYSRFSGTYTGTLQIANASVHVNDDYAGAKRTFRDSEIVLDENVRTAEAVRALGIEAGDFVCFDPRTTITESGYIKSRFLDDKLSAAILLAYAKLLRDEKKTPKRKIYVHFTVYEEVGHGAAASVPDDVTEVLSVDMGCVGDGVTCTEHEVSICAKDSGGPYDYGVTTALVQAALKAGAKYAVDVYPHYGSDAEASLSAGYDVRHGLIGAGVYASHGYERAHIAGVQNTLKLLAAYTL